MAFNFGRDLAYLGGFAAATATGTTLSTTPIIDMLKYNGVVGLLNGVAVTATGNHLVARGGNTTAAMSDLAGAGCTAHTSALLLEVIRPAVRYVDFAFRQTTSGQHGALMVFGTGARSLPTTNSSLLTYRLVNSPGTGTATST